MDIHVLHSDDRDSIDCVFHYVVPNEANAVNVNKRTALVRSSLGYRDADGALASQLLQGDGADGTITAAELAAVQAGAVYEERVTIRFNRDASSAVMRAFIRAQYAARKAETLRRLAVQLQFFGHAENT